ncbi:MAG: ATP-binding protein [Nanoarchaeota archaeon]
MKDNLEKYNLWNKELDYGTDRLFNYQDVVSFLFRKEIQVITGIRRSGKTTLLRQCMRYFVDKGVSKEQILFIPCDDPQLGIRNYEDVVKIIKNFQTKEKVFVFLDEVQVVKHWEKYLKSAYDADANMKFIISGSTASFFERDVANYLTGRHVYHKIRTMNYKEYLRLKPDGFLLDYAEWGGFPEIIKADAVEQKKTLLRSYLQTIILRDIIKRNNLRNQKTVTSLLYALVSVVGGKINIARLSRQFNLSRSTTAKYINISVDAFLLEEVGFFSHSRRKHVQKENKVYSADYGFSRIVNNRFEKGRALEAAVLHVLDNPAYWSANGFEVDFIVDGIAVQVCAADDIPLREKQGLVAFKRAFGAKGILLANATTDATISIEEFILNPEHHIK